MKIGYNYIGNINKLNDIDVMMMVLTFAEKCEKIVRFFWNSSTCKHELCLSTDYTFQNIYKSQTFFNSWVVTMYLALFSEGFPIFDLIHFWGNLHSRDCCTLNKLFVFLWKAKRSDYKHWNTKQIECMQLKKNKNLKQIQEKTVTTKIITEHLTKNIINCNHYFHKLQCRNW